MDSWETLVAGSALQSGTAWDHLQAQTSGDQVTIIGDGMELIVDVQDFSVELSGVEMEVEVIEENFAVEIEVGGLEVPI